MEALSNFCVSIICTIMIVIILEMIIPEGKNKKYVTFVSGVLVTIILLEPILNLMEIDLETVLANQESAYEEYQIQDDLYDRTIQETYEKKLVSDILNRLKENGYEVSNVKVEYDEESLQPEKIFLDLKGETGYVQPVQIEVSQYASRNRDEIMKNKVKNILSENYGVTKDNIVIQ